MCEPTMNVFTRESGGGMVDAKYIWWMEFRCFKNFKLQPRNTEKSYTGSNPVLTTKLKLNNNEKR